MSQIQNKEFTEPLSVPPEDVLTGKKPFLLFEAPYLKLTKIPDKLQRWANTFLGAFITLFITIGAKIAANKLGDAGFVVQIWEYWAVGIVFFVFALLHLAARFGPSDRVTTIREIEEHFRKQPDPAKLWTDTVTKNDTD